MLKNGAVITSCLKQVGLLSGTDSRVFVSSTLSRELTLWDVRRSINLYIHNVLLGLLHYL